MTTIQTSSVFSKIRKANTRVIVNEGSSRSTKTYSIVQYLVMMAYEKRRRITISRAKLTWLKATAYLDFLEIIGGHFKCFDPRFLNKTELVYTFPNGSTFRFLGLDEVQKIHGYKSDVLWLNEAMEIDYADYQQLSMRTTEKIILDYNPSADTHWIYDRVIPRDDCTFIKSTYKDNPFLEQSIVEEIERLEPTERNIKAGTADEVTWKIYGLGERASHKGLIFNSIKLVDNLPDKELWKKHFYGLDFGFMNDPSCLSLVVMSEGEIYMKEIFYKRGLVNRKNGDGKSIEDELIKAEVDPKAVIYADCAEPKSIQELQNAGFYNMRPVHKGPDSVTNGIMTMLRYPLNLTNDSINAIKEKNNYKWSEDRGELTNKPVDAFNHFFDSARYVFMMEFRLQYEDKYKAINPLQIIKEPKTIEDKIKNFERREAGESSFNDL